MSFQIHKRACGYPKAGKIYLYIPAGDEGKFAGKPTFAFALCPTWPLPDGFGLSAQGMQLRPQMRDGQQVINAEGKPVFDMWDWIGEGQYPNPMDWFMEITKLGFHQLVQRTLEFDKLTPESMYYAVHRRAHIFRAHELMGQLPAGLMPCPKHIPLHDLPSQDYIRDGSDTCFRLLQTDLMGNKEDAGTHITRGMPSFSYFGWVTRIEQKEDEYQAAAYVSLPIGRLAQFLVYKDPAENSHEKALAELEKLDAKLQRVKIVEL
jgi:hypothetical protein